MKYVDNILKMRYIRFCVLRRVSVSFVDRWICSRLKQWLQFLVLKFDAAFLPPSPRSYCKTKYIFNLALNCRDVALIFPLSSFCSHLLISLKWHPLSLYSKWWSLKNIDCATCVKYAVIMLWNNWVPSPLYEIMKHLF